MNIDDVHHVLVAGAGTMGHQISLQCAIGHSAKAEPLYERAIAIWEKTRQPDHPHWMRARENHADADVQERQVHPGSTRSAAEPTRLRNVNDTAKFVPQLTTEATPSA